MGQEFPYQSFVEEDFNRFKNNLTIETEQLRCLFDSKNLDCKQYVGGFELEAWLVDAEARPMARNVEFLKALANPEVVPELSLFNIELNVEPLELGGGALKLFENNLYKNWRHCRTIAKNLECDIMSIGVHPSIKDEQLTLRNMSKSDRYKALNEQILAMRNKKPIQIDILGRDHLHSEHADVMLEAAATSFQIHLQVTQEHSVRAYNAAQIISAPLVALSANAPFVFGADLWDESRIPIFEQAVDVGGNGPQRVGFGERYVEQSLMECFDENIKEYPVLIPVNLGVEIDKYAHLRLHNGTIWRWNRPLIGFNVDGSPHVRIENRVVAAGPTIKDMIANAAFYWGLVQAMIKQPVAPESLLPFQKAKSNFYQACEKGLGSELCWLDGESHSCTNLILQKLLPLAEEGLYLLDIDGNHIDEYLDVIQKRVSSKQNGAGWQRSWVEKYGKDMHGLSKAYLKMQNTNKPVHEWVV